ncbi:MAG: hypothetical protein ABIT83_11620 [Massilia sp.]
MPIADAAHQRSIDNTPVSGDIVDLRNGGVINTGECQFMSGPGSTAFGVGIRADHCTAWNMRATARMFPSWPATSSRGGSD